VQRSLVEQAAAGDQRAFEALVRQSAGRLFAIAYRILRDHDHAEDALQQASSRSGTSSPGFATPTGSRPGATG
jgi:DNA-directed RNA polymerase specialized sigma24 family protein